MVQLVHLDKTAQSYSMEIYKYKDTKTSQLAKRFIMALNLSLSGSIPQIDYKNHSQFAVVWY